MNKSEAQQLTAQIRATAHGLWRLVAEAYDRKAWQALGYASWKDYATEELQMSESRSYQLIDTGRVMRAIGQVAGEEVFDSVVVTARETARIKPHMSTFTREFEAAVKDGASPEEAVELALEALPNKEPAQPRGPRIIEGRPISSRTTAQPEIDPAAFFIPAPAAKRTVLPAAVATPFSAPSAAVDQPMPRVPAGRKVCTTCDGHGYI